MPKPMTPPASGEPGRDVCDVLTQLKKEISNNKSIVPTEKQLIIDAIDKLMKYKEC
jgi:hypothetical protein